MIKGPTTYLKTDTSTLSRTALRLIAKETINYCMQTLGTKSSKRIPTVSIIKRGRSRRYGQYNPNLNHIQIHYNVCGTVQLFIQTIIHYVLETITTELFLCLVQKLNSWSSRTI